MMVDQERKCRCVVRETQKNYSVIKDFLNGRAHGNLLSFLLRCGTRPYERGTQ